jgi:hypothetical protein
LFSVRKRDDFVPSSHPLRSIRVMANEALAKMDGCLPKCMRPTSREARPSIAPEKLPRAMLLQVTRVRGGCPDDPLVHLTLAGFVGPGDRSRTGADLTAVGELPPEELQRESRAADRTNAAQACELIDTLARRFAAWA